jgi:hypothetical protein
MECLWIRNNEVKLGPWHTAGPGRTWHARAKELFDIAFWREPENCSTWEDKLCHPGNV